MCDKLSGEMLQCCFPWLSIMLTCCFLLSDFMTNLSFTDLLNNVINSNYNGAKCDGAICSNYCFRVNSHNIVGR